MLRRRCGYPTLIARAHGYCAYMRRTIPDRCGRQPSGGRERIEEPQVALPLVHAPHAGPDSDDVRAPFLPFVRVFGNPRDRGLADTV